MTDFSYQRALAVDDDNDILAQLKRALVKAGCPDVVECLTVDGALNTLAQDTNFQLAVVDLRMPQISGSALLQHIRAHPEEHVRDMSCLVLCGTTNKEELTLLQELGFTETLSKPFVDEHLEKKVHEMLAACRNPHSERNFTIQFHKNMKERKFSQAEALIMPRLKKEPASLKYLSMYAELLFRAGQHSKSEEFLNKILKIDKNFLQAINLLSKIYIKTGRFQEAIAILDYAKGLSPQNLDRHLVLGELHLGSGEAEKAESSFKSALKINPRDERAVFGLGRALATQGRVEESKNIFSTIQKSAELATFFNNKGILLVKSGKIQEGIELYENAIKILNDKSREYMLLYNIALAYFKIGKYEEAKGYAQQCKQTAPNTYAKVDAFIEKLKNAPPPEALPATTVGAPQGSGNSSGAPAQSDKDIDMLLTGQQMEFIMGGFDEAPSAPAKEEPKPADDKKGDDDGGFIMFGFDEAG